MRQNAPSFTAQEISFIVGRRPVKAVYHINQDGSRGGLVPADLKIPNGVYIHSSAVVMPGAVLRPNQRVEAGQLLTREE
jgi:hypothetical protein